MCQKAMYVDPPERRARAAENYPTRNLLRCSRGVYTDGQNSVAYDLVRVSVVS